MSARLQEEIRQSRPFANPEAEAFLNLQRTADALMRELENMLKPAGLTPTQYNVLRILRGAGEGGLLCWELSERMLTRYPDVTRLLDRLAARGLVERARERKDRRAVTVRLTSAGQELLGGMDAPVAEFHRAQLSHLGERDLRQLIRLLEAARSPNG